MANVSDNVIIKAKETLKSFLEGSTIEQAATVFNRGAVAKDPKLATLFICAALVPSRVVQDMGAQSAMASAGASLAGNKYNHTLAHLVGCLILEANTNLPISEKVRAKLGGNSPLSATALSGESSKLAMVTKNKHAGYYEKLTLFKLDEAVVKHIAL
jgi:hypothetical protein